MLAATGYKKMASPLSRAGSSSLGAKDGYSSPFLRMPAGIPDPPAGQAAKMTSSPPRRCNPVSAQSSLMACAAVGAPEDGDTLDEEGAGGGAFEELMQAVEREAAGAQRVKRAEVADASARLAQMEEEFELEQQRRRRQWEAASAAKLAARARAKAAKAGATRDAIKAQSAAVESSMLAAVRTAAAVTAPQQGYGQRGRVGGKGGGGSVVGGGAAGGAAAESLQPVLPVTDFATFKAAYRTADSGSGNAKYTSVLEEEVRRKIFAADLAYVTAHNKCAQHGAAPLLADQYSDCTVSEYRASLTARPPFGDGKAPRPAPRALVLEELEKLQSVTEREAAARAASRLEQSQLLLLEACEGRADAEAMTFKLEGVCAASKVERDEATRVARVRTEEAASARAAAETARSELGAAEMRVEKMRGEATALSQALAAARMRIKAFEEAPMTPKEAAADAHVHEAEQAVALAREELGVARERVAELEGSALEHERAREAEHAHATAAAAAAAEQATAAAAQRSGLEHQLQDVRAQNQQLDLRLKAAVAESEELQQKLEAKAKGGCVIM